MNKTTKTIILSVIVAVLLVAGGFALYKLSLPKQQPQVQEQPQPQPVLPSQLGAVLSYTEGEVKYREPQGEWQKAEADTNLKEGYGVEVTDEGKAIVNLDDGSAVRLNSDSAIILTRLKPDNIIVTLEKGQIYTRAVKAERVFQVKANGVTYESFGTAYKTVNIEEKKGVEVYQSKIKITQEEKEEILVEEGKKYYLKNTADPKTENTVKDLTEDEIKKDKFVMWNKEKDEENEEYKKELGVLSFETKEEKEKEEEEIEGEITLSGSVVDNGVKLNWVVSSGLDASKGYKVVKSTSINPIFPGSNYQYVTNPNQKSLVWEITDGKTYYFRVCQFLGDKCGVYSNNLKLTAPTKKTDGVTSITLSSSGGGKVNWSVKGYAKQGYKLVWSKNSAPTFPTRSGDKYQYFSDPNTKSGTVTAFDGSGKYYVRVCEYLGSKCGVYSNQIDVNLESEKKESKEESGNSEVNSISLSSGGGAKVNWSVDGYSEKGFKVVWSKTSGPTYPTRSKDKYQYLSNPEVRSTTIDAFDGGGVYYVRVCEYLGGSCGVYSNEIQVDL